jgi:hypothetical protein
MEFYHYHAGVLFRLKLLSITDAHIFPKRSMLQELLKRLMLRVWFLLSLGITLYQVRDGGRP